MIGNYLRETEYGGNDVRNLGGDKAGQASDPTDKAKFDALALHPLWPPMGIPDRGLDSELLARLAPSNCGDAGDDLDLPLDPVR